ncbi:hypothetical protein [Paraburkholderia caribensis]|nr:hypothetical protein [Paraburkholderia caribensis]
MRGTSTTSVLYDKFERITISFEPLGRAEADRILSRLNEEKWIIHSFLHLLAPGSNVANERRRGTSAESSDALSDVAARHSVAAGNG